MEYKRVKLTKVGLTGRIPDGLHPRASIMEYHQSNEVWCRHYEDCLEAGLQAALRLM